jgi:hypothetical protein
MPIDNNNQLDFWALSGYNYNNSARFGAVLAKGKQGGSNEQERFYPD